jgi:hypothetical protein
MLGDTVEVKRTVTSTLPFSAAYTELPTTRADGNRRVALSRSNLTGTLFSWWRKNNIKNPNCWTKFPENKISILEPVQELVRLFGSDCVLCKIPLSLVSALE